MLEKTRNSEDLRVRRTRCLLQEKFWELLDEQSFQSIRIQDIAARAMVNRATFYDHFIDKYDLLQYSIREWFRDTLEKQPPPTDGSLADLKGLIVTTCEFLVKLHYHCLPRDNAILSLVQTTITDLIVEKLSQWMLRSNGKLAGGLSSGASLNMDLTIAVTSWTIYGAASYWSQFEDREPVDRFTLRILPTIRASLGILEG